MLLVSALGTILASCITSSKSRQPASEFDTSPEGKGERLIVAEKVLANPQNRILLIGIDQHDAFDHSSNIGVDASKDFKSILGQNLTQVDPKFLFFLNRNGINRVFAFDSHKINPNPNNLEKKELPEQLVTLDHVIKEITIRTPLRQIISLAGFIPEKNLSRGNLFAWLFGGPRETENTREANYLLQLLDGAILDNKYPALMAYFPPRQATPTQTLPNLQLCDLGSVLSMRYGSNVNYASTFASRGNRIDLYCDKANRMRDDSNNEEESLTKYLEDKKIYIERIAKHFTIVSYDPTSFIPNSDWNGHGLQSRSPAEMEKTLKEWEEKSTVQGKYDFTRNLRAGDRIPYAVISESTNERYVTILHLVEPNHQRVESLYRNLYYFLEAGKTALVLTNPYLIPINVADDYFQNRLAWRQSILLEDTSNDFGRLLAFLQASDAFEFNWSNTANDTWLFAIDKQMKLTGAERDKYIAAIKNRNDNETRNKAITEIVSRILFSQGGTKGTQSGGPEESQRWAVARQEHWDRFSNWMASSKNLSVLNDNLSQWAQKEDVEKANFVTKTAKLEVQKEIKQIKFDAKYANNLNVVAPKVCYSDRILTTQCPQDAKEAGRPVILFAVDGLRPDLLKYYSTRKLSVNGKEEDVIPNIKKYFLNRGVHFKGFTEHAVSVASFSTIFTGFEPDYHGLIVANSSSRDPKMPVRDYLDAAADNHLVFFANEESMGLARIHRSGIQWIGDYLADDQKLTVLAPIHDKKFVPYVDTAKAGLKQKERMVFGVLDEYSVVDIGQATKLSQLIKENPGHYRFVENYYISVDHVGHVHNREIDRAIHAVDNGIGIVMEAVANDPVLKNAVMILVSDHGLSGGKEFADPLRTYLPPNDDVDVDNQKVNFHSMFDGDYIHDYPEYRFAIGSATACENRVLPIIPSEVSPFTDFNLGKNLYHNTFDTCRGTRADKNKGRPGYGHAHRTMYLESQGDGRETALILDNPQDPTLRTSFFKLSNYTNPEMTEAVKKAAKEGKHWKSTRNIPQDLLNFKVTNFQNTPGVTRFFESLNGLRPVNVFTTPIQGSNERLALEKLARFTGEDHATRDPILVQGLTPNGQQTLSALIFIKDGLDFRSTSFRYVIIHGFNQVAEGPHFIGTPIIDLNPAMADLDPFHYKIFEKFVKTDSTSSRLVGLDPQHWYTDREILNLLLKNEQARGIREMRPTAIPTISRILTLNPYMKISAPNYYRDVQAMIPDFAIFANEGFHFNPDVHEADHGGLRRSEVQTTFMVSDPLSDQNPGDIDAIALTRDITPTMLDYLGVPNPNGITQGQSVRPWVENPRLPGAEK